MRSRGWHKNMESVDALHIFVPPSTPHPYSATMQQKLEENFAVS